MLSGVRKILDTSVLVRSDGEALTTAMKLLKGQGELHSTAAGSTLPSMKGGGGGKGREAEAA